MLTLCSLGLSIPWAVVEYPAAVKAMKTALEQGANFWNGVSTAVLVTNNHLKELG